MSLVTPPDIELFLTGYLRETLKAGGVVAQVSNKEPPELRLPLKKPLVVVRDDGGNQKSRVSYVSRVGVSVLAGTRQNDAPANALARQVYAVLTDPVLALVEGSPVASVELEGCTTPFPVVENLDVARRYFTCEYTLVGEF